jgi:tetratricopeptide (TPR) repeat protein
MYVPMIGLLIAVGAWFTEAGLPGVRWPKLAWSALTLSFAAGMGLHAHAYTMLWRDAETAYRRSIEIGGVSYAMASNLAATLTNLHYYKTAEVYSDLCVRLWPDHALVVGNHASVLALLGKHKESEFWYRRAMVLDPKNVKPPYMLALLLLQIGRNEEAEVILNDALRLLPPEDDWSSGNQMIRRILLRQVPLSELNPKALLATDTADPSAQRGSK